ncbi:hypothetical protein BT63DRAFT_150990 [Microthyrium microscopicum]|uniref:F-box domain-containing protein n=1 Tax=Microthyrium microscopicum TaxID=703497 RepID=A0A6A6UN83_9PEZI|nr:hypothetical protein BT63DRAFT_150990 [Microthyrium microscopicum]
MASNTAESIDFSQTTLGKTLGDWKLLGSMGEQCRTHEDMRKCRLTTFCLPSSTFPFLRLPLEIRHMVYHFAQAATLESLRATSQQLQQESDDFAASHKTFYLDFEYKPRETDMLADQARSIRAICHVRKVKPQLQTALEILKQLYAPIKKRGAITTPDFPFTFAIRATHKITKLAILCENFSHEYPQCCSHGRVSRRLCLHDIELMFPSLKCLTHIQPITEWHRMYDRYAKYTQLTIDWGSNEPYQVVSSFRSGSTSPWRWGRHSQEKDARRLLKEALMPIPSCSPLLIAFQDCFSRMECVEKLQIPGTPVTPDDAQLQMLNKQIWAQSRKVGMLLSHYPSLLAAKQSLENELKGWCEVLKPKGLGDYSLWPRNFVDEFWRKVVDCDTAQLKPRN